MNPLRRLIPIAFLLLACSVSSASAQDSVVVMQFRAIEAEGYRLSVPDNWRYIQGRGDGPDFHLELSGIAFPATFKDGPLIATVFLMPFDATDLDDAVIGTLDGYRKNADRVFETEKDEAYEYRLKDGSRASILKTRFFRKSKELHQIRYDLIVYSETAKKAYDLTFSIQFADPTYSIENEIDIEAGIKKLFGSFELK
ncbi:MAG TPA: hypothetical protein VFH43_02085 [Candidatus Kapabacteria bacterium]|jgi:hypothetical protein|nr:hypothetical protein [Candidatus Kapabacteria bacterium]